MVTILLEKDSVGRNFIDSVLVRCSIFHGVCCVRTMNFILLVSGPVSHVSGGFQGGGTMV